MTRLKGMVHKPRSPVSPKAMDEAIASEVTRKLGIRRSGSSAPRRTDERHNR